jgi:DNA-binding GntR family transcriptional regulator
MTKTRKPAATLANAAYDKLQADLLSCRLFPGEPIKINEISALLGTTPIAVREALSKLSSEGLVTAEPQKGFRAASISAEALHDLTRVRIEIECICLKSAIANGDVDWETGIVASLHRLLRTPMQEADDPQRISDAWADVHAQYHEALVNGCDSPLLLGIRTMLYAQSERYRRLSAPLAEIERDSNREHREMADAVISRDAAKALALMINHLQTTTDILLGDALLFHRRDVAKGANESQMAFAR